MSDYDSTYIPIPALFRVGNVEMAVLSRGSGKENQGKVGNVDQYPSEAEDLETKTIIDQITMSLERHHCNVATEIYKLTYWTQDWVSQGTYSMAILPEVLAYRQRYRE